MADHSTSQSEQVIEQEEKNVCLTYKKILNLYLRHHKNKLSVEVVGADPS